MANLRDARILQLFQRNAPMDKDQFNKAYDILNRSGVIALPTDTLYGLAAKADDSKALEKIYKIKGRDADKPLSVCVGRVDALTDVADVGDTNMNIFKSLLPGPVTLVLRRSQTLNKDLNPGLETIGVRVPNYKFLLSLCDEIGPLALTSANKSGEKSPLCVDDFKDICGEIDHIFNEGQLQGDQIPSLYSPIRAGSTVIDLTGEYGKKYYRILREGCALNRSVNILTRFGYRRRP